MESLLQSRPPRINSISVPGMSAGAAEAVVNGLAWMDRRLAGTGMLALPMCPAGYCGLSGSYARDCIPRSVLPSRRARSRILGSQSSADCAARPATVARI
jgi:hypothetical protein